MNLADSIFIRGSIVTIDPARPDAEALAVVDGRIAHVGSESDALKMRGPQTRLIDLGGRALLPGFIEAHGHPLYSALAWGDPVVDIRPKHVPSRGALERLIRETAAAAPRGKFLWFLGLDPSRAPDLAEPTKAELNEWAPEHPVVVQLFSFHSAYVNSYAAHVCGLDLAASVPGGQIRCDPEGEAWKLQEAAVGVAQRAFFQSCGDERTLRELDRWLWTYAAAGYTTSSEIGLRQGWADHYRTYLSRFKSPIRIRGYESCRLGVLPAARRNEGDDLFKVIGMKILADGSFFVGNVSLTCPYCDSPAVARFGISPGPANHLNWTREQLDSLIDGYAAQGWQVAVHAQGDATTDLVLDCFERALSRHPLADRPFRIEHCSLMRRDQIDRAISLGVVGSFFTALFFEWGEVVTSDFFGDRGEPYLPSGTAVRRGMRVSYHCDSPMVWPDALQCVQFGVTRRTRRGTVIADHEGVGIEAALRAVTIDAAYHLRMDGEVGSLVPGKLADLVVLDRDPRRSNPDEIAGIGIAATYLAGEPVGKRSEGQVTNP